MPSTSLAFTSRDQHRAWLAAQAALPAGFRTGTARFEFTPREAPKPAKMTLTLLALDRPTVAKSLKAAGYATFFAGKWHLGPEGWWPENQGFDVNMGGNEKGGPYGGKRYFSPYGNPRLTDGPEGEHLPDRLSTEAVTFMREKRGDRQFFHLRYRKRWIHRGILCDRRMGIWRGELRKRIHVEAVISQELQIDLHRSRFR